MPQPGPSAHSTRARASRTSVTFYHEAQRARQLPDNLGLLRAVAFDSARTAHHNRLAVRSPTWVATMLRDEGRISRDQFDSAVSAMRRTSVRIEEALLDIRAIEEPELLRFLASKYKTRFVSTEKLSQLDLGRTILDLVPLRVAEQVGVVPILLDEAAGILSVVTADPDDPEIARQVQSISGVREVRMYLARPAAVRAGIARWCGCSRAAQSRPPSRPASGAPTASGTAEPIPGLSRPQTAS